MAAMSRGNFFFLCITGNMPRRLSEELYSRNCPDLFPPSTGRLKVPSGSYPFHLLRSNYVHIVKWIVRRYVGRGEIPLGPHLLVSKPLRDATHSGMLTYTVHNSDDDPFDKCKLFLTNVRATRQRIGVSQLSYQLDRRDATKEARHRMVLLCDARSDTRLLLYIVDPNGRRCNRELSYPQTLVQNMLRTLFRAVVDTKYKNSSKPEVHVRVVSHERVNLTENDDTTIADSKLGIEMQYEPHGKCVYISLIFMLDILCTVDRSLYEKHFERLVNDLKMGYTGKLGRYNVLMYTRAFAFRILNDLLERGEVDRLKKLKKWDGPVPPRVKSFVDYDRSNPPDDLFIPPPPPYPPPPSP